MNIAKLRAEVQSLITGNINLTIAVSVPTSEQETELRDDADKLSECIKSYDMEKLLICKEQLNLQRIDIMEASTVIDGLIAEICELESGDPTRTLH